MRKSASSCCADAENDMQTELRSDTGLPNVKHSPLTRIVLERFTAFEQLDLKLGPGINVFIGANGTGKTHLLKVAYAACEFKTTNIDYVMGPEGPFYHKLVRVFLPSRNSIQRLVRHSSEDRQAIVEVWRGDRRLRFPVSDEARRMGSFAKLDWPEEVVKSTFIPAKEILSNAPGFRSLYKQHEIHVEEIYSDIIDRAYLPPLRKRTNAVRRIEKRLEAAIGGRVTDEGEELFVENGNGKIEFMLLAEGLRKLGLLWLLVRNGSLPSGSVLFWDEPEANLNPGLLTVVVDILLQLQRSGVQILIATHDYAVLKELELLIEEGDEVRFHALYRDSTGEVSCESASRPFKLRHSPIAEAFTSLYDREIQRSLGKRGEFRPEADTAGVGEREWSRA